MSAVLNRQVRENRKERVREVLKRFNSAKPVVPETRIAELQTEIKAYEKRFDMSTSEMEDAVCSGKLKISTDIDAWSGAYRTMLALRAYAEANP